MQQTDKYQLNLIETSDTFSPAPLNENAQRTEAAIDAARAEAAAGDAALDARVQVLELHKFAYGHYIGNGKNHGDSQIIQIGFTPAVLITRLGVYTPECPQDSVKIVPGGFQVTLVVSYGNTIDTANTNYAKHAYFAFA